MRLVRFLAAGKSLVGLKDNEGRYRLPNGHALPRFGTSENNASSAKAESGKPEYRDSSAEIPAPGETRPATVITEN